MKKGREMIARGEFLSEVNLLENPFHHILLT
jgi:hypothetical protein